MPEQRRTDGDLASDVLGVDDVDAGGRDRDVVDVRAAAGDPAVVQKVGGAVAGAALERFGDCFFPLATAVPSALVLRLVADCRTLSTERSSSTNVSGSRRWMQSTMASTSRALREVSLPPTGSRALRRSAAADGQIDARATTSGATYTRPPRLLNPASSRMPRLVSVLIALKAPCPERL